MIDIKSIKYMYNTEVTLPFETTGSKLIWKENPQFTFKDDKGIFSLKWTSSSLEEAIYYSNDERDVIYNGDQIEDHDLTLYPNEDKGILTVEFANNKVVEYNLKTDFEKLLYDFKTYFNSNCTKIPGETELDRAAALLDDEFEDI